MINESFAYPKKLCSVDWKFPNGVWTTQFYNEYRDLFIFYDEEINESNIKVFVNGIEKQVTSINDLSLNKENDYSIEHKNVYEYNETQGNVVVQVKNIEHINSITIYALNKYRCMIGNREYKTVLMPDGHIWLAENLDFVFDGLSINEQTLSSDSPQADYYDNNQTTYGIDGTKKCGLLYNFKAVEYMLSYGSNNNMFKGWHIPTLAEWNTLLSSVGISSELSPEFKACDGSIINNEHEVFPLNWNGNNATEFNVIPSGYRSLGSGYGFSGIGDSAYYWTCDKHKAIYFNPTYIEVANREPYEEFSVRLIKDY